MTWANAMNAIRDAVAAAAGLPTTRVEWQHTGADGDWIEYPRIKLIPTVNRTIGIPEERHVWAPGTSGTPEIPGVPEVPGSGPLPTTNLIHRYNSTAVNGVDNVGLSPGPLDQWNDMVGGVNLFSSGGSRPDFSNDGIHFTSDYINPIDGKIMVGGGLFDSGADKTWVVIARPTIPYTAQHYFVVSGVNADGGALSLGTYNSNRITWLGGGSYELESTATLVQNAWYVIVARVSGGQVRLRIAGSAGDTPEVVLPYSRVPGWITNVQLGSSTMAMRLYEFAMYDAVLSDPTVESIIEYATGFMATGNIGGTPGTPAIPPVPAVPGTPGYMRREVWSLNLLTVQMRIECEATAAGVGANFAPADRLSKLLRTTDVGDILIASRAALHKVGDFSPVTVMAENRELSVVVGEALFQVIDVVDTTPQPNGADWFNRVQISETVTADGDKPETTAYVVDGPESS